MPAKIIDGRLIREKVLQELKEQIACLNLQRSLKLAIFQYKPEVPDELYVHSLKRVAKRLEIDIEVKNFEDLDTLKNAIYAYNENESVDGIMLQIRDRSDYLYYTSLILPEKDVDGATPVNLGKLVRRDKGLRPATADAVIRILKEAGYEIRGKNACVLGRSFRSGLPIAIMLMNENATCTVCHSRTKDITFYTREADILVVAVGHAGFVRADMVKEGSFVIDVGINQVGGKVVGDVNFDEVKEKCAFITPVPGGVGSVTDVMIFRNLIKGVIFRNEK